MARYVQIDVSFRESIQTNMKCSKISPFVCGNIATNYDEIADEIFRLRELRQQTTHLTEFDESLVRRWIKQITIWDDHITVELKSGVSIDVDI